MSTNPAPDSPGAKQTAEHLRSFNACPEAVEWASKYRTRSAAWKACKRGDWMIWYAGKMSGEPESAGRRKLVGAATECARLALPIWQKRHPDDKRIEVCLDCADRWARGEATIEELREARRNAYAAYSAAYSAAYAAYSAYAAADAYSAAANYSANYSAAYAAAYAAADAYYSAAAAYAARSKVLAQCADIVRKHYPTPPKP